MCSLFRQMHYKYFLIPVYNVNFCENFPKFWNSHTITCFKCLFLFIRIRIILQAQHSLLSWLLHYDLQCESSTVFVSLSVWIFFEIVMINLCFLFFKLLIILSLITNLSRFSTECLSILSPFRTLFIDLLRNPYFYLPILYLVFYPCYIWFSTHVVFGFLPMLYLVSYPCYIWFSIHVIFGFLPMLYLVFYPCYICFIYPCYIWFSTHVIFCFLLDVNTFCEAFLISSPCFIFQRNCRRHLLQVFVTHNENL